MTFLNLALLGGLAAAALPILIHLFHRSRFRTVRWGAMHLLQSVVRQNTRRLRIEQWILLAIRTAIPALLALCLARPILTGVQALLGGAKSSVVLLLDNSGSMNAGSAARSNWAEAREAADRILAGLPSGSEAAVVWLSGEPDSLAEPTFDLARLRAALQDIPEGFGMADPAGAFETAAGLLSRMRHAAREVVVLSDFQKASWDAEGAPGRERARGLLAKLPAPPHLVLLRAGVEAKDNIQAESLELSRPVLGIGQPLRLRATLKNHGSQAWPSLRTCLRVDGRERAAAEISLGAGETTQVLFTHAFDKPGSHVVEISADADALRADNGCMASVPVWDRLPVLLASGEVRPEPLKSETGFLEIALRPFAAARASLADIIVSTTVDATQLTAAQLAEARVLVLANVPQLTDEQAKAVEDFAKNGGGVLVFPGSRLRAGWWNNRFAAGPASMLPCRYAGLGGDLAGGRPAAVLAQRYDHPALGLFNDPKNGTLASAAIRLWAKLDPAGAAGAAARIPMRLDTGDPFLAEKEFGGGRVLQCSVPCDADWSDLPLQVLYLPLMQQLTIHLASTVYPPRNVEIGQKLVLFLPVADAGRKITVTDPGGKAHEIAVEARGARSAAEWSKTGRPGLYTMKTPAGEEAHFVVAVPRRESEPALLAEKEFSDLAAGLGASAVASVEEYGKLDRSRRYGQEVWKPLLALLVGLFLLEMFLEQRWGRRSPSGAGAPGGPTPAGSASSGGSL